MDDEAKNPVKATKRSLRLVEAMERLEEVRLTTLADEVDLPYSTVHSHLMTLVEEGYVAKQNDLYRLSLRFFQLGERTRSLRKIHQVTKPELAELAEETGEVALLMVEERGLGVVLDWVGGTNALPVEIETGMHIPLHTSASGKAILAYLPDDKVDEIVDYHGLPAHTNKTITNRDALYNELQDTYDQTVAYDRGERVPHVQSIAVPIRDQTGRVVGSIGVFGPVGRLSGDILSTLEKQLHDTSDIVELKLVHSL